MENWGSVQLWEGVQAGYNVRYSFRIPFRHEGKERNEWWRGDESVERDIFIGSYAGVGTSRFVISVFPKARKRERWRDRKKVIRAALWAAGGAEYRHFYSFEDWDHRILFEASVILINNKRLQIDSICNESKNKYHIG